MEFLRYIRSFIVCFVVVLGICLPQTSFAQEDDNEDDDDNDILVELVGGSDSLMATMDTVLCDSTSNFCLFVPKGFEQSMDSLITMYSCMYHKGDCISDSIGEVLDDSIYIRRLAAIPSVMEMNYNKIVKSYIALYTVKRRKQVELMLGLSSYYFPKFEDVLDEFGLPMELKHLPVIESALNPNAYSHAGASGLWQFIYSTGKMYGLDGNSLVDERRDPWKATRAAASYLKNLYSIYGDWHLVIAAYNCGPGNVNKAIRRAGGKRDYWAIYPYLPVETRGYVPAFIAATYTFTYYKEHNICPGEVSLPLSVDTVQTDKKISLKQISEVLGVDMDIMNALNPQYRRDIVPGGRKYSIALPGSVVNGFIELQDTIYNHKRAELCPDRIVVEPASGNYYAYGQVSGGVYRVKKGDTLGAIARRFRVSVNRLRTLNNLKSDNLSIGQRLRIR